MSQAPGPPPPFNISMTMYSQPPNHSPPEPYQDQPTMTTIMPPPPSQGPPRPPLPPSEPPPAKPTGGNSNGLSLGLTLPKCPPPCSPPPLNQMGSSMTQMNSNSMTSNQKQYNQYHQTNSQQQLHQQTIFMPPSEPPPSFIGVNPPPASLLPGHNQAPTEKSDLSVLEDLKVTDSESKSISTTLQKGNNYTSNTNYNYSLPNNIIMSNQTNFKNQQQTDDNQTQQTQHQSSCQSFLRPKYGLMGMLGVIRMTDPDLNTLALGMDLTTLGLNLNSSAQLCETFNSPWPSSEQVEDSTLQQDLDETQIPNHNHNPHNINKISIDDPSLTYIPPSYYLQPP